MLGRMEQGKAGQSPERVSKRSAVLRSRVKKPKKLFIGWARIKSDAQDGQGAETTATANGSSCSYATRKQICSSMAVLVWGAG